MLRRHGCFDLCHCVSLLLVNVLWQNPWSSESARPSPRASPAGARCREPRHGPHVPVHRMLVASVHLHIEELAVLDAVGCRRGRGTLRRPSSHGRGASRLRCRRPAPPKWALSTTIPAVKSAWKKANTSSAPFIVVDSGWWPGMRQVISAAKSSVRMVSHVALAEAFVHAKDQLCVVSHWSYSFEILRARVSAKYKPAVLLVLPGWRILFFVLFSPPHCGTSLPKDAPGPPATIRMNNLHSNCRITAGQTLAQTPIGSAIVL